MESTDVAGLAVLLVFVRYTFDKSTQDLLMRACLHEKTTEDIFNFMNDYITKHELGWEKCIDVCTDGARPMIGKMRRVETRILQEATRATNSHCIWHRQAQGTKKFLQI